MEEARSYQNLQGKPNSWECWLAHQVAARGRAGEGAARRHKPSASRLIGRESVRNGNVFVEEAARLEDSKACSW